MHLSGSCQFIGIPHTLVEKSNLCSCFSPFFQVSKDCPFIWLDLDLCCIRDAPSIIFITLLSLKISIISHIHARVTD